MEAEGWHRGKRLLSLHSTNGRRPAGRAPSMTSLSRSCCFQISPSRRLLFIRLRNRDDAFLAVDRH